MEYRIERKEAFCVVGVSCALSKDMEESMRVVPRFWAEKAQDGTIAKLCSYLKEGEGLLGLCTNSDEKDHLTYTIGIAKNDLEIDGMESQIVEPSLWAIFPGRGPMPQSIQEVEKRIITDWLPSSGYEFAEGVDVEVYLDDDPTNQSFEVWMPIKP